MATITRLSVDLVANDAKFKKDLRSAAKSADKSFGSMMRSAKLATAAFAGVGAALGGALLMSARVYGDFTEALQDVKSKTGATTTQLNAMEKSMRNVAKETKFTATQTAEAGTFLAQAGLSIIEINEALRPTLDLAAASRTGVQQTAKFMTDIMKGMGLANDQLVRAADVLSKTTASSNTNLTDLAEGMKYAAPYAVEFGMSIEETAAMLGVMANAGIKGTIAGTALRGAFTQLVRGGELTEVALANSTGAMTKQAVALRKLGVVTRKSSGEMRPLLDIIDDIKAAGGDADDMVKIFGSIASGKMLSFLRGGSESIRELTTELEGATGAAKSMSDIQMDQLNGDVLLFNSQLQDMQIEIASNGLNDMLRNATKGATSLLKMMEPTLVSLAKYADELAIALASIGGVLVLLGIGKLILAMKTLSLVVASNPIFLLVAVATAIFVGLAIAIYNNLEYMQFHTKRVAQNIATFFSNSWGHLKAGVANFGTNVVLVFSGIGLGIMHVFNGVLAFLQVMLEKFLDMMHNFATEVAEFFNIDLSFGSEKLVTFNKGMAHINKLLEDGTVTAEQHKVAVKSLRDAYADFGSRGIGDHIRKLQASRAELSKSKAVFEDAARNTDVYMSKQDHFAIGVAHLNSQLEEGAKNAKEYTEAFNILGQALGSANSDLYKFSPSGAGLADSGTEAEGDDPMRSDLEVFLESMKLTEDSITKMFDNMGAKASSVFTDILRGSTSLSDGFADLGNSILDSVVGSFVQMGVEYVKQKLLMFAMDKLGIITTSATTAAAGASMAVALAPAAAMMSLATAGTNSVGAMAGMTAAHTLSGTQALLGQFHDGIDNVPSTGTYLLESGERVVDKRLNKDMSQFLADQNGGGGNTTNNNPTLNFNVSGGDAENVERMLMNHRGKFEGMIRDIYAESAQNAPF